MASAGEPNGILFFYIREHTFSAERDFASIAHKYY